VGVLAPLTVVLALALDSLFLGVAGVCLCGATYGFCPTTGSVFAARFYGRKNFALNFSMLNLILVFAPLAATLAGTVRDATGGFMAAFIVLTALSAVGFFVNLGIKKP
jgi:OFA family oxalate/formate antiporter-like MFS transporter